MLVHHPDAERKRLARGIDVAALAVDGDFALVRHVQAGQDIHQRGLAGAVFTQQGVDLAGLQVEVNVIVGEHRAETFHDAGHFDDGHGAILARSLAFADAEQTPGNRGAGDVVYLVGVVITGTLSSPLLICSVALVILSFTSCGILASKP